MRTSRPIATISYNTDAFLDIVLGDLTRRNIISFWCWIQHLPEEDETKAHKHLYLVPNGQIDTDSLRDRFVEVDVTNLTAKPRKTLNFRPSKFADWYLYALHDSTYLDLKGQARKYHYTREDVFTSDEDELTEEIHMMDLSKLNRTLILRTAAESGVPFAELVARGQIPIQQTPAYKLAYDTVHAYTWRGDRTGHEDDLDTPDQLEPERN